jgi:hypothetical protein
MSKVGNSTYCLSLLASDLQAGKSILAETPQWKWLDNGILKYMVDGGESTLDKSLGLAVCGSRHASTQLANRVRNHYLILAINHISLDDELSDWAKCGRLAEQVNKLCPFWQTHKVKVTDINWPTWKVYLHQAWLTDIGIPGTARGLYSVKENSTYSLHDDELIMYQTIKEKSNYGSLVFNQGQR